MLNKYFIHNQFIKIKYKTILNEKKNPTVQGIDMIQIKNNTNIAIMYNVVSPFNIPFFRLYIVSIVHHYDSMQIIKETGNL